LVRARLEARLPEIRQTILARVQSVSDPAEVGDPEYVSGLHAAISAALTNAVAVIEDADGQTRPLPVELLSQARHAARAGVSLDTVLRRYCAGNALFSEFMLEASAEVGVDRSQLCDVIRSLAQILDRVLDAVATEYERELRGRFQSADQRRAQQVRMLLGGELLDSAALRYELDAWHLALVGSGPDAVAAIRELAFAQGLALLHVRAGGETIWAWLGSTRRLDPEEALSAASRHCPPDVCLALGEPGRGVEGWRLSHRQAIAAFPVAQQRRPGVVRHADVVILASALQNEVLADSLRDLYLTPLSSERDGGEALRQTVRAYFAANRNVSAAAAALGVSRPTVKSRLSAIEERIGRHLDTCAAEFETALRLEELGTTVLPRAAI